MSGDLVHLELRYRSLTQNYYRKTSERTPDYNCIAYVAGDFQKPWWPVPYQAPYFWPIDNVEEDESIKEFIEAFSFLGYECCSDSDFEPDFQKIVIFIDEEGFPSHMAKQLPNGYWSSKCGDLEDIEHDLNSLIGGASMGYGQVAQFMKKRIA
jgi:hypothetical protein